MTQVTTVGIIGAGTMGAGIAAVAATAGPTTIVDVAPAQLDRARTVVERTYSKWVAKGRLTAEAAAEAQARITYVAGLEALSTVDLVIEAVPERMDIKQRVFTALADVVRPDAILATNTSGLRISDLAGLVERPERVLGVHFFNPVPVMALVEVIRAETTDADTVAAVLQWLSRIGKTPVEVREHPGFVVNRILIPMINEAAWALTEQVATAADIDTAMKLGANHPIGPLALGDLIGLDTCLAIMENLRDSLPQGDKYAPAPALVDLVAAGKLGRKTGAGFFTY